MSKGGRRRKREKKRGEGVSDQYMEETKRRDIHRGGFHIGTPGRADHLCIDMLFSCKYILIGQ